MRKATIWPLTSVAEVVAEVVGEVADVGDVVGVAEVALGEEDAAEEEAADVWDGVLGT